MERLRQGSLETNPFEVIRKTERLIRKFPSFQEKVQLAIAGLSVKDSQARQIITDHYGMKYEEMGFCTKAFADTVAPQADNTDIGICATEFYMFIDILDDLVDDHSTSFNQKATYLEKARTILKGEVLKSEDPNAEAMICLTNDLRRRVAGFSISPDGVNVFIGRGLKTIDTLYREARKQSRIRNLVALAQVGRGCSEPLMELIHCKLGDASFFGPAGNLVSIGNILDDYWDVVKDKKKGKSTFLTISLPEKEMGGREIILRTLVNCRTHVLAINYVSRLFTRAMAPLGKDRQESVLAIALFAQIGVFKRRYESVKAFLSRKTLPNKTGI